MIFPFPYSNLYNLNLDWMIKTMKEMQAIVEPLDRVVNSVNNMTGDVVLTKAFLLNILESMVSKFNGRAGDVTLTAADVNSTMIDITWTSDPGDVIGDLAQNVRDQLYAIGKRVLIFVNNQGVPDQIYFLTLVGDVVTPQIYSPTAALAGVASFNGQTGAVTATGSDLDTANDDDTPISESIGDLQSAVNDQSQQIGSLKSNLAIIASGTDTHSSIIYKNQFVYANGILYQANNDIPSSTSISANSSIATGIANKFLQVNDVEFIVYGTSLVSYSSKVTSGALSIVKYGRIAIMTLSDVYFNGIGDLFDLIQNPALPLQQSEGILASTNGNAPIRIWLRANGTAGLAGTNSPSGAYSGSIIYMTAN